MNNSQDVEYKRHELTEDEVGWDGEDDPHNPMNWGYCRKLTLISLTSFATFNDCVTSSLLAPGVPYIMAEFGSSSNVTSSLLISVHVLGYVAGPLLLSPLSEIYGRLPLMHGSNVAFVISSVICAASVNIPMMMIGRIIMGLAGCVPITLGGGLIADLTTVDSRGSALSIWSTGLLLGVAIGPIIGGYMTMSLGWRWMFWLEVCVTGFCTVVSFLLFRETYAPVLLARKAGKRLGERKKTILRAILRPTKLILFSPILVILAIYDSVGYVYMYFLITDFPRLFSERYHFNPGEVGLTYLGQAIGLSIGQITMGWLADRCIKHKQALQKNVEPEDRLLPVSVGCCVVGISMFWYGWSVQAQTHWILPICASGFMGVGINFLFGSVKLYLVDAFHIYAVSAIGAETVIRSVLGALLPLAEPALYDRFGYGWGNSLLGFVALALIMPALLLLKYGKSVRTHPKFQTHLE